MDSAYVATLGKHIIYVKYLLARQDLFVRNVDVRGMKTKDYRGMVLINGIVYNRNPFQCSCTTFSKQYTRLFYNLLNGATECEGQWDVAISEKSYPSMYQNVRESSFFLMKDFQSRLNFTIWNPVFILFTKIAETMNTLIQERHNDSEYCITAKVSRRKQKIEIDHANEGYGPAFFSTNLRQIFGSNVGNEFGVMLRGEVPHEPKFAYDIVRIHSLMMYMDLTEYSIVGST